MKGDSPGLPQRRSIRILGFNYSQSGVYYVTICTQQKACLFGEVVNGGMRLNDLGRIVQKCWLEIPSHFTHSRMMDSIVMPNHLHGLIVLRHINPNSGTACCAPTDQREAFGSPVCGSIATIVRSFKSAVTKTARGTVDFGSLHLWQRGYYEHVIRNEHDLQDVVDYVRSNPLNWGKDPEFPTRRGTTCHARKRYELQI